MKNTKWLMLQLFSEGGSGGASGAAGASGEGATSSANSGENESAVAEQRLRELGVPESKIRKRAYKSTTVATPAAVTKTEAESSTATEANAQVAAAETDVPSEESKTETPKRMTWDEIMADPEYNKEMQNTLRSRLRSAKTAEENLNKLVPAIELLARKYGQDPANVDYEALAKSINDDDNFYEEKALEMGVPIEEAKKSDIEDREKARKAAEERTIQEEIRDKMFREHYASLERQGEEMKKVFPNFNLQKELENPAFARMTAPGKGVMSVEDAYNAVHRKEIQAATMQITAQKTAEMISNNIQAGNRRPDESGTTSQAPSVTTFDYRNATPEQRNALKKRIHEARARGEKLYPGQ